MSAWWMWDNHTFTKIDLTNPLWRDEVMECWDQGKYGHFFVRGEDGRQLFEAHENKFRELMVIKLNRFNPALNYQI